MGDISIRVALPIAYKSTADQFARSVEAQARYRQAEEFEVVHSDGLVTATTLFRDSDQADQFERNVGMTYGSATIDKIELTAER